MSATPAVPNPAKKVRKTYTVPRADVDFGTLVKKVAKKWKDNDWVTLQWTNAETFMDSAAQFDTGVTTQKHTKSYRSNTTTKLEELEKKMAEGLKYVKIYLTEKYKNEALSLYPQFGIEHVRKSYVFPADQDKRLKAIGHMLKGVGEHGFGAKEYGTAFWTPIKTDYEIHLATATSTDGTVSQLAGNNKQTKAYLKKTLNALIRVLVANYPDTYKTELRAWGFQKEKY